ncbi:MAG: hypothetical protein ACJATT_001342 [Myxococcota bacterium]|jgi:hypothetical protein
MNDTAKITLEKLETARTAAILLLGMSVLLCIGGAIAYWYVGTADLVLAIPIVGSLVVSVMAYNKNERLLSEFRARYPEA